MVKLGVSGEVVTDFASYFLVPALRAVGRKPRPGRKKERKKRQAQASLLNFQELPCDAARASFLCQPLASSEKKEQSKAARFLPCSHPTPLLLSFPLLLLSLLLLLLPLLLLLLLLLLPLSATCSCSCSCSSTTGWQLLSCHTPSFSILDLIILLLLLLRRASPPPDCLDLNLAWFCIHAPCLVLVLFSSFSPSSFIPLFPLTLGSTKPI